MDFKAPCGGKDDDEDDEDDPAESEVPVGDVCVDVDEFGTIDGKCGLRVLERGGRLLLAEEGEVRSTVEVFDRSLEPMVLESEDEPVVVFAAGDGPLSVL